MGRRIDENAETESGEAADKLRVRYVPTPTLGQRYNGHLLRVRNHEIMYLSLSGLRSNYEEEEVEYMLMRLPSH